MPFISNHMTTSATPVVSAIPGVWVHTTLPAPGASDASGAPAFLTPYERDRLERVRQSRMLLDGRHREYFLDEGRTQFDFRHDRRMCLHGLLLDVMLDDLACQPCGRCGTGGADSIHARGGHRGRVALPLDQRRRDLRQEPGRRVERRAAVPVS